MIHPENDARYDNRGPENRTKLLQEMIRAIGVAEGDAVLQIAPSGVLDARTRQGLRRLQAQEMLPPSGVVDNDTWDAVVSRYERSKNENVPPAAIRPLGRQMRTLRRGEQSDTVLLVQILLGATRLYYDTLRHVPLSGVYDAETEEAVRELQRLYRLEESGELDLATWNRLAEDYSRAAAESQ